MVNLFEQTMIKCQEMKQEEVKKTNRKKMIAESKVTKKKKVAGKLKEDVDIDLDPEEDIADDVSGDIIAVIDPEMNSDDYEDRLDDLEDIIDGTPEGEVPLDDTYVGDEIYQCPICGDSFFSEVDLHDGGICPVCGEETDDFVELGVVESADENDNGVIDDDEGLDPEEDLEIEDDYEDEEEVEEELELVSDDLVEEEYDPPKTSSKRPSVKNEKYSKYSIDEKRFDSFMTKLMKENYKNAESMRLVKPSISGSTLKLECEVKFKSGKTRKETIVVEGFKPAKKMKLEGKIGGMFKAESFEKQPHLTFEADMVDDSIKINSMKYNYVTLGEGKKYQIYGGYALKESLKTPVQKTGRKK